MEGRGLPHSSHFLWEHYQLYWRQEALEVGKVMLTGMERISQLVEEYPERKLQTLMHLVNKTTLTEVHKEQERGKASGNDKITKTEYE